MPSTMSAMLAKHLDEAHVLPLWLQTGPASAHEPRATEARSIWRWKDLEALGELVGESVSGEDAERRVLVLANPGGGGKLFTTGTLNAALQVLNAGERAAPHRHSMAAIRIITQRDGGVTTVNDHALPMSEGDLILTPAWTWHGHYQDGATRAMWIDVLDVPLVASWDGVFFEHPEDADAPQEAVGGDSGSDASTKLHFPWREMKPKLEASRPRTDGSREVRYTNLKDGGAVFPTIDCFAMGLAANKPTDFSRSTASSLIYVLDGEGRSTIGDQEFPWSKGDVFTIPNWRWASHLAGNGGASLLRVSNSGMLATLGLLRSEAKAGLN